MKNFSGTLECASAEDKFTPSINAVSCTETKENAMPDFLVDSPGPGYLSAVFEDEGGTGYLYLYDRRAERILLDLPIYGESFSAGVDERDVTVVWSSDGTKCGVSVLRKMRGVIDVTNNSKARASIESEGVDASFAGPWLEGFDLSGFVVYDYYDNGLVGFFEDDVDTGYLYVYDTATKSVVKDLQVYTRVPHLGVLRNDIEILWSGDGEKCAVAIWGGIRGIIDLRRDLEGRILLESQDTPSIVDPDWISGFDLGSLEATRVWAPVTSDGQRDALLRDLRDARKRYWKGKAGENETG